MRESIKDRAERLDNIYTALDRKYPHAGLRLVYGSPLDLLIASILAAQCRDEKVNEVTSYLFERYKTAADYGNADVTVLEQEIGSIPLFRRKARSIKAACESLVSEHGGAVPADIEALTALSGVGRKTANLILSNAFDIPAIVVDTHVIRIAGRLKLSREDNADKIERDLMKLLPKERWSAFGHLLATFGRDICTARAPRCPECSVNGYCPYFERA